MAKDFKYFFFCQFLGAFNDNVFKNALVILITFYSISIFGLSPKMLVPLAGGVFIFPFFIFSGSAGQIADKYSKKNLIVMIKACEIVIMAIAALGFYLNRFDILLVVLFFMGAQSAFFGPLKYAIIPSLVEKDKLVSANAMVSGGTFVAILLGTILGGFLASKHSYTHTISIAVLVLAVMGFIFARPLIKKSKLEVVEKSIIVDKTFVRSTMQILINSLKEKEFLLLILGTSWFWFLGASVLSLLPLMVKKSFNGPSEMAILFLALFTLGMGLGSYGINKISKGKARLGLVPFMALFMSFCLGGTYLAINMHSSILAMISICLMSFFGGGFIVTQMSALQAKAPYEILSRLIAANNIWNSLFMVIGSVLIMVLLKLTTIENTFLVLSVLVFFSSIFFYFSYKEQTSYYWTKLLTHTFYKVEAYGLDNIPQEGRLILIGNHVSFIDWLFVMATCPRPIRFVIDYAYYYKWPFTPFFKHGELIPIATRKQSDEVLNLAFQKIDENLKEGHVLGIFPEGWLTRDGKMRALQPGVNKIIRSTPTPVVLVALDGLWGSFFSHKNGVFKGLNLFKRRKVSVTYSEVFSPEVYDRKDAQAWFEKQVSHYH